MATVIAQEPPDSRLASSLIAAPAIVVEEAQWPVARVYPSGVSGQGCVRYLRQRGFKVPQNPSIHGKYLPVDNKDLPPEGREVLVVSYESPSGHVSMAKNIGGKLITTVDNAGVGREIPLKAYKGYIN